MKFKKNRKNIFLATMGAALASSLVLAACGPNKRTEITKVRFALPFKKDGPNHKSIQFIVDKYNEFFRKDEAKNRAQGYLPVEAYVSTDKSYGGNEEIIGKNITARDWKNLPQLTFGYSSLVVELAKHKQELNLGVDSKDTGTEVDYKEGANEKKIKKPSDKLDLSNYGEKFRTLEKIFGLPSGANDIFMAPAGVSTLSLFIARPVLHYLINKLLESTSPVFTIAADDAGWFKSELGVEKKTVTAAKSSSKVIRYEDAGTPPPAAAEPATPPAAQPTTPPAAKPEESKSWEPDSKKQAEVGKIWGGPQKLAEAFPEGKRELSKAIFENYDNLFEFATSLAKAFKNTEGATRDTSHFTLGMDSVVNHLYLKTFNELGVDNNNFLWHKATKQVNGKAVDQVVYPFLKENTKEYNALKRSFEKIKTIADLGSMWYPSGTDTYTSTSFTNLKLPLSFGSTAGLQYRYSYDNSKPASIKKLGTKKQETVLEKNDLLILKEINKNNPNQEKSSYYTQGGSLIGINSGFEASNRATKLFAKWLVESKNTYEINVKGQKDPVQKELRNIDYYALKNSYLPTTQDFWSDSEKEKYLTNPTLQASYETLNSGTGANFVKFSELNDRYSGDVRKQLGVPFGSSSGFKDITFKRYMELVSEHLSSLPKE